MGKTDWARNPDKQVLRNVRTELGNLKGTQFSSITTGQLVQKYRNQSGHTANKVNQAIARVVSQNEDLMITSSDDGFCVLATGQQEQAERLPLDRIDINQTIRANFSQGERVKMGDIMTAIVGDAQLDKSEYNRLLKQVQRSSYLRRGMARRYIIDYDKN